MNGRSGPAKTIICGVDAFKYLESLDSSFYQNVYLNSKNGVSIGSFQGMDVIVSPEISSNKIVELRYGSAQQWIPGIMLVNNTNDGTCFFGETPSWEKNITWFNII